MTPDTSPPSVFTGVDSALTLTVSVSAPGASSKSILRVVGDVQRDVGTTRRLEALELDGYGVAANRQLADAVDAIRVGDGGARKARVECR